jgi:hypothetical protein
MQGEEERKDFTQRARRKNTEITETENPRAQPGMAVPREERNPRGWLKRPALHGRVKRVGRREKCS